MRLYLARSSLLYLNTGVACFRIQTHQQQCKHNMMQLPPMLEGHNLHSRTFLRKGWAQLSSQSQYTEPSSDSIEHSHLQHGFNLMNVKLFSPRRGNYLSLSSSCYWHLLEKYLFYEQWSHFLAEVRWNYELECQNTIPIQRYGKFYTSLV